MTVVAPMRVLSAARMVVPAAHLLKLACAGDGVGKGERVGAVCDKDGVVDDVAGDGAGHSAIAELKNACGNCGGAGVGIVGGEDCGAGAKF